MRLRRLASDVKITSKNIGQSVGNISTLRRRSTELPPPAAPIPSRHLCRRAKCLCLGDCSNQAAKRASPESKPEARPRQEDGWARYLMDQAYLTQYRTKSRFGRQVEVDVSPENDGKAKLEYAGGFDGPSHERTGPMKRSKCSEEQVAYALR